MSIARGDTLTAENWTDFVNRLRHHCVGDGVRWHETSCPIFVVQSKLLVTGIDPDYTDKKIILREDSKWFSPAEYFASLDEEEQKELNETSQNQSDCDFLDAPEWEQYEIIADQPDNTVTGYVEQWVHINSHLTKEGAEAFIRRKAHDYDELRVYVESQYYCWEFNTIRNAILAGVIGYIEPIQTAPILEICDSVRKTAFGQHNDEYHRGWIDACEAIREAASDHK